MPSPFTRIVITGAGGKIGRTLRAGLRGSYPLLRLLDAAGQQPAEDGEEVVTADINDFSALRRHFDGIDCVVHLAGVSGEADWDPIFANNVGGTFNVFEAARLAGVRRVVFASSNHVVGFYRNDREIGIDVPLRPDSRYAVSKAFGEALGRLYADKHGMSVACLRIGSFREKPESIRQLSTWCSPRDMVQLVRRCIDAPEFHYLVAYGMSANRRGRWQNPDAERIGYRPQDDAEAFAAEFREQAAARGNPEDVFHGGPYTGREFDGDMDRID
jgi:uronate dehydrogenase